MLRQNESPFCLNTIKVLQIMPLPFHGEQPLRGLARSFFVHMLLQINAHVPALQGLFARSRAFLPCRCVNLIISATVFDNSGDI